MTETALYAPYRNGTPVNGFRSSTRPVTTTTVTADERSAEARYQEASEVLRKAIQQSQCLVSEAQTTRKAMIDRARSEADEIVARARAEAADIVDHTKAEIDGGLDTAVEKRDHQAPDHDFDEGAVEDTPRVVSLVRSGDISTREFPVVRRGADPASVRKWLEVVELSHAILEEELDRARAEWGRSLETLARTASYLMAARDVDRSGLEELGAELERAHLRWERSVEVLSRVRTTPSRSTFQALLTHAGQYESNLRRVWRGYCTEQVGRLVDALVTQLSRLQMQIDVLRTENEQLRDRLLWHVADSSSFSPALLVNGQGRPACSGGSFPD